MKKVKGIAAFAAAVMALNSATIVFAASPFDGGAHGVGIFEGNVDLSADVFQVTVPTEAEGNLPSLSFILDPNNLISQTSAMKYNSSFNYDGANGLYFRNLTGAYDYSKKSDEITATNNGTSAVNISVTATLSGIDEITCVNKTETAYQTGDPAAWSWNEVKNKNVAAIYMKLSDTEETATTATLAENTATISHKIEGATVSEGTGGITWTEEKGYYYASGSITGKDYTFYLEGEAGGDWSGIKAEDISPELELVWKFKQVLPNANPSVDETIALSSTVDTPIPINYGGGDYEATGLSDLSITSTGWAAFNGKDLNWLITNNYVTYNEENGELIFKAAFANQLKGRGGATSALLTFNNTQHEEDNVATAGETTATIIFTIS